MTTFANLFIRNIIDKSYDNDIKDPTSINDGNTISSAIFLD